MGVLLWLFSLTGQTAMVTEPRIPATWQQSVRAKCDEQLIEINGYGASDKRRRPASVMVNGRRLSGNGTSQLHSDLSVRSAVYRITILCGGDGNLTLRLYRGEASNDKINYHAGFANIKKGRLLEYSGLQPTQPEGFWFR